MFVILPNNCKNARFGMMKNTYWACKTMVLAAMAMVLSGIVSSCMEDEKVTLTPESAIVSFSVASIKCQVTEKKYDSHGNSRDTIVVKTIDGSGIYFNIDQKNGHIYTVDSLPSWADLRRVVPTVSAYGNVYAKYNEEGLYYPLTSGSDSLDFTKPVELATVSTDGNTVKYYTVDMYKHVDQVDTLAWMLTTANLGVASMSKTLCCGDRIFVFGKNAEDKGVVASSQNGTEWSAAVEIAGGVDVESIVVWKDAFYAVDGEGNICSSAAGQTWAKASDKKVERLLCGDACYLYAKQGEEIIGSTDLNVWSVQGVTDLDMLPDVCVNSSSYASKTNDSIQVTVMTGLSSANAENGVAWFKLSALDEDMNQMWSYIEVTPENPFGLPRMGNLCVANYAGSLFALGTEKVASGSGEKVDKYRYLYRSFDNGISWHAVTEKYMIPAGLDAANGKAQIVAKDGKLWIIQENGNVWQGSIR